MTPSSFSPGSRMARRQRGAVLYVAMVVLVALALAALALLRSVDVAGLVATNLSFKRSALNATDLGTNAAVAKFIAARDANQLMSSVAANCYSARIVDVESNGVPSLLSSTSSFDTAYGNCRVTNTDTGETVRFYIDRQCSQDGLVYGYWKVGNLNVCTLATRQPSGTDSLSPAPLATVLPLYRITVRTDGPRNAVSYVQVIFKPT